MQFPSLLDDNSRWIRKGLLFRDMVAQGRRRSLKMASNDLAERGCYHNKGFFTLRLNESYFQRNWEQKKDLLREDGRLATVVAKGKVVACGIWWLILNKQQNLHTAVDWHETELRRISSRWLLLEDGLLRRQF